MRHSWLLALYVGSAIGWSRTALMRAPLTYQLAIDSDAVGLVPRLLVSRTAPMRVPLTVLLAVDSDAVGPVDDCWEIVGAPRTATTEEIRKAYRRRARTLHPDVPGGDAAKFRRLVSAFETLMDHSSRAAWENSRRKTSARERANRAWNDMNKGTASRGGGARERPAGSRRTAEQRTQKDSDERRQRWREMAFEQVWREHMPLAHATEEGRRAAFLAAMEVAVQSFVRDGGSASGGSASGGSASGGSASSPAAADVSTSGSMRSDAEELREILKEDNIEVLRGELQDAQHRITKHRERVRWLEGELALAENKAAMWHGATPGSESERVNFMERELSYLQFSNRLRERLADQRLALQQLTDRQKQITGRLSTPRDNTSGK